MYSTKIITKNLLNDPMLQHYNKNTILNLLKEYSISNHYCTMFYYQECVEVKLFSALENYYYVKFKQGQLSYKSLQLRMKRICKYMMNKRIDGAIPHYLKRYI